MVSKGRLSLHTSQLWPIRPELILVSIAWNDSRSISTPPPPGWDASPLQGYPPALSSPIPIYTPGWREALWELSVLPKNTTQCPRPGLEPGPLDPETSALTMRPPRLPHAVARYGSCFSAVKWETCWKTCETNVRWQRPSRYYLKAFFKLFKLGSVSISFL